MQRESGLIDDLSEDGDLAMWAEMSRPAVAFIIAELDQMTLAECNDWCRRLAEQLLVELGLHFSDWERGFCNLIIAWVDQRRLSVRQIEILYKVGRNGAGRALAAERRKRLRIAMPANLLPA